MLQRYDSEWNDWVNCGEDYSSIANKSKLKIILKDNNANSQLAVSKEQAVSIPSCSTEESVELQVSTALKKAASVPSALKNDNTTVSVTSDYSSWPVVFQIPEFWFPDNVKKCLKHTIPMSEMPNSIRRSIVSILFTEMRKYDLLVFALFKFLVKSYSCNI